MKLLLNLITLCISCLLFVQSASAFNFSDHLYNRQLVKQSERHSVYSFLTGSSKQTFISKFFSTNNNQSLFEFQVEAANGQNDRTDKLLILQESESHANFAKANLFFWVLGVGTESTKFKSVSSTKSNVSLRIWGSSEQDSKLSLFYGDRSSKGYISDGSEIKSEYYGVDANLYLINQIGVRLRFEQIPETNDSFLASADLFEYEVFLEYGAFRIFTRLIEETLKFTDNSMKQEIDNSASLYGLSFFF